jgi:hypothetical protein
MCALQQIGVPGLLLAQQRTLRQWLYAKNENGERRPFLPKVARAPAVQLYPITKLCFARLAKLFRQ